VALVIFGVLTVAISFTFETALTTQESNNRRLTELAAVRSVFDYMTRDLQQAYASSTYTSSVFIAGGSQTGPQSASTSGGLLSLMTRGNRIISDQPAGSSSTQSGPVSANTSVPQSETIMVRYDFDPQAQTLSRTVVTVPSLDALQQAPTDPDSVIATHIDDISLRFWDTTQQTWRTDWDYEQQNQQQAAAGATGATGAAGAAGATGATPATSTTTSTTGDTMLPSQVEVTVTVRHQDHTTATYTSTIQIVTYPVSDGMAPPTNPVTAATTTTGATN